MYKGTNSCLAIIVKHMIAVPLKEDKTMCKTRTKMFDFWHCMCDVLCGKGKKKKGKAKAKGKEKEGKGKAKRRLEGTQGPSTWRSFRSCENNTEYA